MSSCIMYRKHEYLIVKNRVRNGTSDYYTIINTRLNTHVHINDTIKLCKIIVKKSMNKDFFKCNEFLKHKIEILLGLNEDWNQKHKVKIYSHNIY